MSRENNSKHRTLKHFRNLQIILFLHPENSVCISRVGGGRIGFVLVEMWREMGERSREPQLAITATSMFPGFRFSPTDEELISHYLKKKLEGSDKCVEVIPEVDICKSEPWDLPAKSVINSENEWFFFSYRGRKYPHGSQNKRATESGYWKATGKERNVKSGSNVIGTKRTLVFHTGRAPKGERTEWIMHEYCMSGNSQDSLVVCRLRKNIDFRLNDIQGQGSLNEMHLATENSSNVTQSEVGVLETAKAVESCSKECSGSHSIEQKFDPESESDLELANELSHPGSSTNQQGYEDDDDECYADILKDDIIDIGKPILPPPPDILPFVGKKTEHAGLFQQSTLANPLLAISVPGRENSRIRMRFEESIHPKLLEQQPKCVILSWGTGNHGFIFIVFFFLVVMLLPLLEFLW